MQLKEKKKKMHKYKGRVPQERLQLCCYISAREIRTTNRWAIGSLIDWKAV